MIRKIKKEIEVEETLCDICGERIDEEMVPKCYLCGKDVCKLHLKQIYFSPELLMSTLFMNICEDCFSDLTIKDLTEEYYKRNGGHITK